VTAEAEGAYGVAAVSGGMLRHGFSFNRWLAPDGRARGQQDPEVIQDRAVSVPSGWCKLWPVIRGVFVGAAVTAALAAACSSSSGTPNGGTLSGVLEVVGGPIGAPPDPVAGTITMRAAGGTTRTATVGADGKFSAKAPAGSYTVTGRIPSFLINGAEGDCLAIGNNGLASIQVRAGQTTSVTVECFGK